MTLVPALLLSTALAALALWRRALTPGGTALAWALCAAVTALGGGTAFAVLAVTLLLTAAADRFAGGRADPNGVRRKSGSRDVWRVACTAGRSVPNAREGQAPPGVPKGSPKTI